VRKTTEENTLRALKFWKKSAYKANEKGNLME